MKSARDQRPVASKSRGRRSRQRDNHWLIRFIYSVGLLTLVSFTSGAALGLVLALSPLKNSLSSHHHLPHSAESLGNLPATLERPVNILVLGIDNSGHPHIGKFTPAEALAGNSDTMLLVRLEPQTHQINILSIPRDTQVKIPGIGIDKINAANVQGGASLAAQTASQLLGGIPIDRYVRVDTEGFIHLADALGGVDIRIPKAMSYRDKTQNLDIHFSPGQQRLNGQHLQEYVRFRHDELGDIGRVQRQQDVLKSLLQELLKPATLTKVPQLLQVAQENIDTDLSVGEILAVLRSLSESDLHRTNFVMLPGRFSRPDEFSLSYWLPNPQAISSILSRYFAATDSTPTNESNQTGDIHNIKLAIANATDRPELTEKVLSLLRARGFSNAYRTDHEVDASDPSAQTVIIAQQGNPEMAETVKQVLGLGEIQIAATGDIFSDVTLVLRADVIAKLDSLK